MEIFMQEFKNNINIKKNDGTPIKFNFQYENGLPVKPIIYPPFEALKNKKNNINSLYIFLPDDFIKNNNNINIEDIYIENDLNIWIVLENYYIVLQKNPSIIIESVKNKKINIRFFDTNKIIISGFNIS